MGRKKISFISIEVFHHMTLSLHTNVEATLCSMHEQSTNHISLKK